MEISMNSEELSAYFVQSFDNTLTLSLAGHF